MRVYVVVVNADYNETYDVVAVVSDLGAAVDRAFARHAADEWTSSWGSIEAWDVGATEPVARATVVWDQALQCKCGASSVLWTTDPFLQLCVAHAREVL